MKLDKFNMSWLGNARTITVGKDTTTIVDGKGETEKIDARIEELKAQIEQTNSPYEIELLSDIVTDQDIKQYEQDLGN